MDEEIKELIATAKRVGEKQENLRISKSLFEIREMFSPEQIDIMLKILNIEQKI